LFLPILNLAFLLKGPTDVVWIGLWTLPLAILILVDEFGPREVRRVPERIPPALFDALLYFLVLLQIANILALGFFVRHLSEGFHGDYLYLVVNLLVVRILGGTNACCSVIAPAHELIHRKNRWQRWIGRALLMSVFHDPFYVTHRLGHHVHLGGEGDPSMVQDHEDYESFFRRTLLDQWRLAWSMKPRTTLLGLACSALYAGLFATLFGGLALFMLVYQSVVAIRLLEAVNYFQHLGLSQRSGLSELTAWRCDRAVSLYLFVGLSRHADHHRHPQKSYAQLEEEGSGPLLPGGYLFTAIWVKNASRSYRRRVNDMLGIAA
jgi:alkane 1-monooxygenase